MKKKIEKKDDRSLRTFFLYTFIVFFVVLVSLSIKAVSVLRQSKFDGNSIHLAITQNNRVTAIMGIDSNKNSSSLLKVKNSNISISSVGQSMGIIVEGRISSKSDLSQESPESILTKALGGRNSVKTDLTVFDVFRLILLSKSISDKDKLTEEIKHPVKEHDADKIISSLFRDDKISAENVSIEIVNATNEPGLGKRLERCLSNIGANVVAVTTPHIDEKSSKIQYFGGQTYTLEKLGKALKFPVEKINKKTIAKIVIIIGENNKNASAF